MRKEASYAAIHRQPQRRAHLRPDIQSDQGRHIVRTGEGEALPSIRALAKDLRISVITTKRAYDELESEGFIYTLPGKGCFVAERSTELLREENLKKIEGHMQEVRRLASACRLTENELDEMWRLQKEEAE